MSVAINKVADFLNEFAGDEIRNEFMLYEPWDVDDREEFIYREAEKRNIDLRNPENEAIYGKAPHLFQSGYMFYSEFIVSIFGGNQIGKSYCAMVDLIIMMTGEIPYSLRYEKGHDTGILRDCNPDNVRRFGRWDANSGRFLDYNANVKPNGAWNCGTIKGAGIYPKEKIAPRGSKGWLGTFSQAKDEYWWPRLKKFIPDYMIDTSRGNKGFSERKACVYLNNSNEIHVITYEQGYAKFEAENVWVIVLDEEPPDQRIFTSSVQHISKGGVGVRLIETPYRGLTWTRDMIIAKVVEDKQIRVCHATQFDSPYQDKDMVITKMRLMKPWEIEARVFGIHSEQRGRPFYDRERINKWLRVHMSLHKLMVFESTRVWDSVVDAMSGDIMFDRVYENDERVAWEIYEDPMEGMPYWLSADTAEGAEKEEDAQDRNAAHIFRPPIADRGEDASLPVIVASIRSSLETQNFARICLYAAMSYNFALIAPESKGETAATFIAEIREYPFLYEMTVTNDKTRRPVTKIGFDTNVKTRRQIFDCISEYINQTFDLESSPIPHLYTLKEMAELVKGKKGRPDHPNGGTSDCLIALGIGLYVWTYSRDQIRDNSGYHVERIEENYLDKWKGRIDNSSEKRPVLGSKRGLDERSRARRVR